jgi:hypothetical protein
MTPAKCSPLVSAALIFEQRSARALDVRGINRADPYSMMEEGATNHRRNSGMVMGWYTYPSSTSVPRPGSRAWGRLTPRP